MGIIALLTDFGDRDGFVGMMKGAILHIAPDARIVDISHQLDSFDLKSAAFLLERTACHFPSETIFAVVVDPGVGGSRRILAAAVSEHYVVAPDNGVGGYLLAGADHKRVHSVESREFFAGSVSNTFHGRDIMAPVAAHLHRGVPLEKLGPRLDSWVTLQLPNLLKHESSVVGEIVYVDKFGNMISNISSADLPQHEDLSQLRCTVGGTEMVPLVESYAGAGGLAATVSGMGTVEVFLDRGRAADRFAKPVGTVVAVERIVK